MKSNTPLTLTQELFDLLQEKNWYRHICENKLAECFDTKNMVLIVSQDKLKQVINDSRIFRYAYSVIDFKIFRLLHNLIEHGELPFLTVYPQHTWLTPELLETDVNVETQQTIIWNVS